MVAASRAYANGKSPVQNAFQMYFGGLEAFSHAYEPFVKGLARAQLEVVGLASRRAKAYVEAPGRIAHCRTPQDVFNAQAAFWREAYEDYMGSMARVQGAITAFPAFGLCRSAGEGESEHDYITFPETKEQPRSGRERKAA